MKRTGKIHYASIEDSARLQRVVRFLMDGAEHSTLDIILGAKVAALTAAISELRENGITVTCRKVEQGHYLYRIQDTMMRVCCDCRRVMGGVKINGARPDTNHTHGYCRKCYAKAMMTIGTMRGVA